MTFGYLMKMHQVLIQCNFFSESIYISVKTTGVAGLCTQEGPQNNLTFGWGGTTIKWYLGMNTRWDPHPSWRGISSQVNVVANKQLLLICSIWSQSLGLSLINPPDTTTTTRPGNNFLCIIISASTQQIRLKLSELDPTKIWD